MPGKMHTQTRWLNVSNGKLKDKQAKVDYDSWDGRLVKIERVEKEYEGVKYWEVQLNFLEDDGQPVKVTFREESFYAYGFFGRLLYCDNRLPLEVGAVLPSGKDKGSLACLKQSDAWVKLDDERRKEVEAKIPPPEDVVHNGKPVMSNGFRVRDWTKTVSAFSKVMDWWNTAVEPVAAEETETKTGKDEDLPF